MADGGDGATILPFKGVEIADPLDYPNEGPTPPKEPEPNNPEAVKILTDAYELIEGPRHEQHGKAERCHGEIAKLWTWWTGFQINAHDVAIMMTLLKISRIKTGGYNRDCSVDAAAYLALAGQLRKSEATPQ